MDEYWISLAVVLLGAFIGMILPYLIKCYEEPETKFEWSYFYSLVVTMIVSGIALIPGEIYSSPQYYVGLLLAGLGLQTVMGKAKTRRA